MHDETVGKEAVRRGLLTGEELAECRAVRDQIAARGAIPPGLSTIAREKGFLTPDDLATLYKESRKGGGLSVPGAPARKTFRARAAQAERSRVKRASVLFLFFAASAVAGAVLLEFMMR